MRLFQLFKLSILTKIIILVSFLSMANSEGYIALQNFDCVYVTTAFEDERKFRNNISPPPSPRAFTTVRTRDLAQFIAGYITAFNTVGSFYDNREEPYDIFPPGLFAAIIYIEEYCKENRMQTLVDALLAVITSPSANQIKRTVP